MALHCFASSKNIALFLGSAAQKSHDEALTKGKVSTPCHGWFGPQAPSLQSKGFAYHLQGSVLGGGLA